LFNGGSTRNPSWHPEASPTASVHPCRESSAAYNPSLTMARVHRRRQPKRPALTVAQILIWADTHHRDTGSWPTAKSGTVLGAPGEYWAAIDQALYRGLRGLRGNSSVRRLLQQHGRVKTGRSNAWTAAEDV